MLHDDPGPSPGPSFEESGWERPRRVDQHTLFADDTERSLAAAGVSPDEANEWFERGWLSSMPAFVDAVDEPAWVELLFVRDVARSVVPSDAASAMLKQLQRPFTYDACRVAYNFRYGWVELSARRTVAVDPRQWSVHLVKQWVEIAARCGQRNELHYLLEAIYSALDAIDREA